MFPVVLDVHTHSISSGHYSRDTITDMVKAAVKQKLTLLGISEHGPAIPHSCTASYFRGLRTAPKTRMGIHMLYGAEVNIMDYNGKLDLENDILKGLDYCIAGMHTPCLKPGTKEENTQAYICAMKNPYIKIIAHPDDVKYPVDYDRLLQAAMEYGVLLEINNSSLSPDGYRGDTRENDRQILSLCKRNTYPVLLSSDSHGHSHIGDVAYALALAEETGFPPELVINHSQEDFLSFLRRTIG